MGKREIPGYCTLCRSRCGTLNTVHGDRFISVRPDPSHPTGSAMCAKGRAAPELVHSPHRLLYPMRRTQPKGAVDPGWQRISWDEALTEIADKLRAIREAHGAEAVVFGVTTPSGTPLSDSIDWIERFVRHYGSPNICYATEICNWHKDFAHAFTFGVGMPTPDVRHADLIMLWGHNPAAVWLAQANAVGQGRAAGARLLVVDPRPTALAQQADCWLRIKPGYDAALALGLIHLLIQSDQFDHAFVARWTNATLLVREDNGHFLRECDLDPTAVQNRFMVWDEASKAPRTRNTPVDEAAETGALRGSYDIALRMVSGSGPESESRPEAVPMRCMTAFSLLEKEVAVYTPAFVSELTSITEEAILAAAELIGGSKRIAYHAWSGVGQHTNATQTERAIAVLYALTGCFDRAGGNRLFSTHRVNPISQHSQLDDRQRARALGIEERPVGPPSQGWVTARDTWQAILQGQPYRVQAMFNFGSNPLSSQGDTPMARAALAALPFHVQCDLFETPTAKYADILLPVGTPWEREGLRVGFELDGASQSRIQLRRQLISPRGECRSDNDIVFELARRLGMHDAFFGGSLEAGWNHMLAPVGITVAQLREQPQGIDIPLPSHEMQYRQTGFKTETACAEVYSEKLLRHGQSPLPCFVPPAEFTRTDVATRFPIVLSSAKNGHFCHSQHRSLVTLRKRSLMPTVQIAPALAEKQAILDGDPVLIATRHGRARFSAKVTPGLADEVAVAEFGWWQSCPEIGAPAYPLEGAGNSHYNGLISSEARDPISGSVAHRSFRCGIVRDPAFDIRRRTWPQWRAFTVSAIEEIAEGVASIAFTPTDGGGLPDFLPGQHITVSVPMPVSVPMAAVIPDAAATLVRAYSLTGAARDANRECYTIAVRHQRGSDAEGGEWQGAMSTHLHTSASVGQQVLLRAPGGKFTLPVEIAQPVIFIAGGIGITPFISQLETLLLDQASAAMDITLHYANRGPLSHAFKDRLAVLSKKLPGLRVIDYYAAQRITDAVVSQAQIAARARVYMCGPEPMMTAVRSGLVSRGMPDFDIFHEAFRSPVRIPSGDMQTHRIIFRRSARTEVWTTSSGTLLEFAERHGVALPSGCRVGQCESCALRVVSGTARHLHGTEPDESDVILSCQAVPLTDMEIDA